MDKIVSLDQVDNFIGKYGHCHLNYLKEHQKNVYAHLLSNGKLKEYLQNIDICANERLELLMKQMAEVEGVDEALKSRDQMGWVGAMNNIKARAEEIIFSELIYV